MYALPEQHLAGRIRQLILVKPHWRGELVKLHVKVQENVGHDSFQLVDNEESARTAHKYVNLRSFQRARHIRTMLTARCQRRRNPDSL